MTCKKNRIATDLYYYYDEIDYKNECMLDNCIQAIYIKGILKNIHSLKSVVMAKSWR